MLVYDGIVFSLQRTGGISVLFSEIIARLPSASYEIIGFNKKPPLALADTSYRHRPPRILERYRYAAFGAGSTLFHSTYYRLPAVRGPKVVTTVHDFVYERFASPLKRLVHSAQKRNAIRGSDCIICVSESTRRDLLEFVGTSFEDRTVVVPNGVSDSFHRLMESERLPQVLFVGGRVGYKNFASVVEAVAPLRDIALVCVGGGPFTSTEVAMLEDRLPSRHRWTGYLSNEQLNREYNRSLCLAYTSRYEGFGIPVLEAMRAGCPVVAVNSSSLPEVAGDAALLLERGEPEEIRRAIEQVLDSSTREAIVSRGLARARLFSWDETFRQTITVYERLIGRRIIEH